MTVPLRSNAQLKWNPSAKTAFTPLKPHTDTGEIQGTPTVPGSPSSPNAFPPQHCTVVLMSTAQVWESPAEIETAPVNPRTCTGVVLNVPTVNGSLPS